ncbi:hypothetical protein Fcan01_25499 [Folsomia candida]|uniref:C2H2-type domain-containing protein n=1 Tax=Folsomia candida TaxID=158441 RepID=A0A226D3V8_FOLCA|nr:hypothetical protein Fcan01_25499 [Folsomia candida]
MGSTSSTSTTSTKASGKPTLVMDSQNFLPPDTSKSSLSEINVQLKSHVPIIVKFRRSGGSIWIQTENTPTTMPRAPPPPKISKMPSLPPKISLETPRFQNAKQLVDLIQTCRICDKSFRSRRDGVDHQRKEHNLRHCPVCFDTISRQGIDFKEHLKMYHVLEEDKELLSCPFCLAEQNCEGLYRHISWSHLIPVEVNIANREATYPVMSTPHGNEHHVSTWEGSGPSQNHPKFLPNQTSPPNPAYRKPGPASKTGRIFNQGTSLMSFDDLSPSSSLQEMVHKEAHGPMSAYPVEQTTTVRTKIIAKKLYVHMYQAINAV